MKQTRPGFSLLEVIIALALTSMILGTLFTTFFSINNVGSIAENMAQQDTTVFIIYHQLQKDLSAATLPFFHLIHLAAEQKKPTGPNNTREKKSDEKEKAATKPIKRIFSYTQQSSQFKELTFISTNPLFVYESAKNTKPKSRLLRITYSLVEDENKKGSFNLYRKENTQLEITDKTPQEKGLLVAQNIKSMSCSFEYPIFKKDEKTKQLSISEIKKVDRWQSDELLPDLAKTVLLPQFISFKIILWNATYDQEQNYEVAYALQGYDLVINLLKNATEIENKPSTDKGNTQPPEPRK